MAQFFRPDRTNLGGTCTVEPLFNEPLFNENLDITDGILGPSDSKIYEKEPRYNDRIWPVHSDFVKSRSHCTRTHSTCKTKLIK